MRPQTNSRDRSKPRQSRGQTKGRSKKRADGRHQHDLKWLQSRRSKNRAAIRAAKRRKKKVDPKILLARQKHRATVNSALATALIMALIVVILMMFKLAGAQNMGAEIRISLLQKTEEKAKPPPQRKAKVQQSASRPRPPAARVIRVASTRPAPAQPLQFKIPIPAITTGLDIETPDFGDGGFGDGNFGNGSGSGNGGGGFGGTLGGLEIKAQNLGVILDISGSMTNALQELKKEIEKDFPKAPVEEVLGCSISGDIFTSDAHHGTRVDRRTRELSTISTINYLVEKKKVDAIFWFCDLQDNRDSVSLRQLKRYLDEHKVSFFVCSIQLTPDEELSEVITKFSMWEDRKRQ